LKPALGPSLGHLRRWCHPPIRGWRATFSPLKRWTNQFGDDDTPAPGPAKAIAVVHSEKCLCTGRLIDVEGTPSVTLTRSPAGAVGVAVGERFEYHGYDTGKRTRFAWAAWRVSSWGLRG